MKFLFLIAYLVFNIQSFAKETQGHSNMLANSHCIPVRGADGNISNYSCDDQLGEKMKQGQFQNLGTPKVKKMEIYNSINTTHEMGAQRPAITDDKIKSCLAGVYTGQISYYAERGTFSARLEGIGIDQSGICKGLVLSVDYANNTEFKVIAKANDKIWAVDQTKKIQQVR